MSSWQLSHYVQFLINFLQSQATFAEDFMRTYWNRRQMETTPRIK